MPATRVSVPLFDLTRQYAELQPELERAALDVLRSGRYVLGDEVEQFERELCEYTGAHHAVGVSSGTDALLAALMALDVSPGDAVLMPVYSFFATAGVVHRLGARPVFVDVEPTWRNIDPGASRDGAGGEPRRQSGDRRPPVRCWRSDGQAAADLREARRAGDRRRRAGDRHAHRRHDGRRNRRHRLLLGVPDQESRRLRRRRLHHDQRRRPRGCACAACATTARPTPTDTRSSAAIFASTRCRQRCCASNCGTSSASTSGAAPTPTATARCSPMPPTTRSINVELPTDVADRHIYHQFVTHLRERRPRHGSRAHARSRARLRGLLPAAVAPAAVLRRPRRSAKEIFRTPKRRRTATWRCRFSPNCATTKRSKWSADWQPHCERDA